MAFGADAVYCGLKDFNLRAGAENFSLEELPPILEEIHQAGRKFYLALNIFARPEHIQHLQDILPRLSLLSIDAIIVSDPGVISLVRKSVPNIPIHLSTQANTMNAQAAEFWRHAGIKRIILARELSLEELQDIRRQFKGELEVFVHGAMCMSYSGRCFLSDYMASRRANEGDCAQPCRWTYRLQEERRSEEPLVAEEDEKGTTFLSSYDLCLMPYLDRLVDCGIDALKIEGRMKTIYYLSWVIHAYRKALDEYKTTGLIDTRKYMSWLERVSHRKYSNGFLFSRSPGQQYGRPAYHQDTEFVGEVRKLINGLYKVDVKNRVSCGEVIRYFSPVDDQETTVKQIKNERGESLSTVHSGQICLMGFTTELRGKPVLLYRHVKEQENG